MASERIPSFDPLPACIRSATWQRLERGLISGSKGDRSLSSRLSTATRPFLKDWVVPRSDVEELPLAGGAQMRGFKPPLGRWCHVAGLDLIR